MPLKRNQSFVSLFDIRLKSTERDVVVIRGPPEDSASVLLSGTVVIAALDPMTIKRVTLRAQGVLRLRWTEHITTSRGPATRPVRYEKTIFDHEWANLESGMTGRGYGGSALASLSSSTTNLAGLASSSTAASPSTPGTGNNNTLHRSSSSHSLAQGNHELPFSVVIPGDITESVEGLDGAQVIYKLTATVERGRFSNNLHAKKHFRIVRTVGSDSFEMAQTMSIDNVWPNKVEYTIETPTKAVAIGSSIKVNLLLVPLLKGLKLGTLKIQLVQHTTLTSPSGQSHTNEKTIHEQLTPPPEGGLEGQDKWELSDLVPIPASLSKCTQDVEVGQYIKVGHKLKFAVGLVNPDGHVSELRASLPIYLFISPNVTISSFDPTAITAPGIEPEEETLFDHSNDADALDNSAPPNYESHVYDRLWNEIPQSSLNSPTDSGETSPYRAMSRRGSDSYHNSSGSVSSQQTFGLTLMNSLERSQLAAGLRALEQHQQQPSQSQAQQNNNQQQQPLSTGSSRSASGTTTPRYDYFNGAHGSNISNVHNNASGSSNASPILSPRGSDMDVAVLSRVPSYETALKDSATTSDTELAPGYEDGPSSASASNPSSPRPRFTLGPTTRPALARNHSAALSTSAPGSSLNLNSLQMHVVAGGGSVNDSGTGTSSNSSSGAPSTTNLRQHQRNHSSSTLGSLLHKSSSSRSLFGLKKYHD